MAEIDYIVTQDMPDSIAGVEQYSNEDKALVTNFQINNLFDSTKNIVELHILDLSDNVIDSFYDYSSYKQLGNAQSAGKTGASILTIDPVQDAVNYGYPVGGVKLLYHFLNDLFSENKEQTEFYVKSISEDRTELLLQSLQLTADQLTTYTQDLKNKINSESYFAEFRLNFKDNNLFIGTNVDILQISGETVLAVKLYEPLPVQFSEKTKLQIVEFISDSVAYEVDVTITPDIPTLPTLSPPNFNIDIQDETVVPSQYYDYNDLFSYPVNNTNSQLYSLLNEKGAEISVDFTDYSNFVHFSSAQERLANFKYKLDLIQSYSSSIAIIASATSGSQGVTGSISYYENLITGSLNNFDLYERYLYYENTPTSWPKQTGTKPYINLPSNSSTAILWYASQSAAAIGFDNSNFSSLENGIPVYLRDDNANMNLLTFIHMLGQHFDNLWLYAKAVTDKYDADNRLDFGVSKDLISETLQNFGVKLYTSNKSLQDLFGGFLDQSYKPGQEIISHSIAAITYITGSGITGTPSEPVSYTDYQKEIYKRIYHNLPLILKAKGTERGVRALINCFGIPSDILTVKFFGGRNIDSTPHFGDYQYYTSSLGKIRLDNTGSLIAGNTLSENTSTYKTVSKYTDDLHKIDIGFSPSDNIDNYILSASLASPTLSNFNIDNYIGDPSDLYKYKYDALTPVINEITENLTQYNLADFVRLIKFFDNVIFKIVRDFIPARTVADTGVIIKPSLLTRSKIKSPESSVDVIDSGSVDNAFVYNSSTETGFISGSSGGSYGGTDNYISNADSSFVQTPLGTYIKTHQATQDKKYNGELSGSETLITNGELNSANPFKIHAAENILYNVGFFSTPPLSYCTFGSPVLTPLAVRLESGSGLNPYTLNYLFSYPLSNTTYNSPTGPITGPSYSFTGSQYDTIILQATSSNSCTASREFQMIYCDLTIGSGFPGGSIPKIAKDVPYNFNNWFNTGRNTRVQYVVTDYPTTSTVIAVVTGSAATAYVFPTGIDNSTKYQVTAQDITGSAICSQPSTPVTYENCLLSAVSTPSVAPGTYIDLTGSFSNIATTATFSSSTDNSTWTGITTPHYYQFPTSSIYILCNNSPTCYTSTLIGTSLINNVISIAFGINNGTETFTPISTDYPVNSSVEVYYTLYDNNNTPFAFTESLASGSSYADPKHIWSDLVDGTGPAIAVIITGGSPATDSKYTYIYGGI